MNDMRKFAKGIKASSDRQNKYCLGIDEIFVWVHFVGWVSYQVDEIWDLMLCRLYWASDYIE